MSCQCVCDIQDKPAVFETFNPVARKPHTCCECQCMISVGTQYHRAKGLWDGDWFVFTVCSTCANIRQSLAPCAAFGTLWETLRECLGLDYITGEFTEWWDKE